MYWFYGLPPYFLYPPLPDPYVLTWTLVASYTYIVALSYYLELYKLMLELIRELVKPPAKPG